MPASQSRAHATVGETPSLHLAADGRATLTLRRPQQLNRLHREDLLVLAAHLARLAAEPGLRVLVLAATGRVFSAGFHIGELQAGSATEDPHLFEHTVDMLQNLPLPTLARLHGSVYGGATDLALACDFRIGVPDMVLRMPAAALGLHYYASGMQRFSTRLGPGAARRLFLLADTVPAQELLRIGYLDALVPATALDAEVDRMATLLADNAPLAVQGMKLSLNDIAQGRADLATLREREARCAESADLREGLAAFAGCRTPRFSGH